ncbi:MAG TPA: oligosaccharide flippase family protein [Polyangia bacterium]|nr:oligosaccharide flippase family protein [Polyangia bacterium]
MSAQAGATGGRGGVLPARFLRSATANYLNSLAALLMALFATPILVRGLGKEAYGTWTLVTSSVLYYSLLQFGLGRATVKFLASAQAVGDLDRARRVISTSFLSLSVPALALIAASPGIAFLFPEIFHLPEGYRTAAMVLVVLSTIDFAIGMPSDTFGGALVGLQRFDLLNATATGTALAQVVSWIVIIALGGGLVPLGIATLTFSVTSNFVRYAMVRRLLGGVHIGRSTFERPLVRPMLAMSSWIAVSDLVEIVTLRLDPVIVALVGGIPQVAVYSVGQKLSAFVERFTGPALAMFFPHAAALSAFDDHEEIRRTLLAGTRLALALTLPLTLVVSVLASPAIRLWVGSGFGDAAMVTVFLALTSLVVSVPRVGIYVLRGMGDVSFIAKIGLVEAAINLGASVALGHAMGIKGVALGTLIGVVVNHLGIMLTYVCRRLGVGVAALVATILRAHLLPVAASLAVGLALQSFARGGVPQLGAAGLAVVGLYAGLFAFTGLSSDERRRLRQLGAQRLRRAAA